MCRAAPGHWFDSNPAGPPLLIEWECATDQAEAAKVGRLARISGMAELPPLSPANIHVTAETAQRFLASAYDSVESMLESHAATAELAEEDLQTNGPELAAKTAVSAQDMLRAMIVFTGAGLDTVLKQLIRDALPSLLEVSGQARQKFSAFVESTLDPQSTDASRRLARYLLAPVARNALIEDYLYDLTGSSLQSSEQVSRTLGALGIADAVLRSQAEALRPLFIARNQIVHELDLLQPGEPGDRERRARDSVQAIELSHQGLEFAQQVINHVVMSLTTAGVVERVD
jgi:hypothetical protein